MRVFFAYFVTLCLVFCGEKSVVDCDGDLTRTEKSNNCIPKTEDERAMLALEEGDLELAQSLLEKLIIANPEEYFRFPRLAAVYAALAEFNLLSVAQTSASKDKSDETSEDASQVEKFIPVPKAGEMNKYELQIAFIKKAADLLLRMPENERDKDNGKFYGASAELQLTLYQSAYSLMLLKRFSFSVQDLSTLTAEDALEIVSSLLKTAELSGKINPELAAKAKSLNDQIDAQEGTDVNEKVSKFLADKMAQQQQVNP